MAATNGSCGIRGQKIKWRFNFCVHTNKFGVALKYTKRKHIKSCAAGFVAFRFENFIVLEKGGYGMKRPGYCGGEKKCTTLPRLPVALRYANTTKYGNFTHLSETGDLPDMLVFISNTILY